MSEFQTVKRRGHSQNANAKYPEQHQQLVEMGFESSSVSRALDASNGDMEAATAVLIGEGSHKNETEEKVVPASKERKAAASTVSAPAASTTVASAAAPKTVRQSSGLAVVAAGQSVKDIKETHQRMIATYKVQKCKETGAHDRKMCMHYHSLSDRRRNPFDTLYSCYECPNTVDGGECPDGDSCMHSHTMLERMFHPELYKISVCQRQLTGNKCDRAMLCAFAHNDADLRISPSHLTTKYAMQEEAKTTPVPVNQSAMLDHIRINLVKLIKEHGSEGVIAADLPKYYQGKFHESLDIIDESGKKYKLKDLIGPHNNIHVVLTGQPKFVYGDPSIAAAAAESQGTVPTPSTTPRETSQTSSTTTASSQTVKDRVVELIKAAGAEGILATEMSKKYQERYGEKLEKDWNVGLNTVAGMVLTQTKQYTKYTFNAITAGIKDAALPSVIATKDGKAVSNSSAASSKAPVASAPASAPAQPTASSQSAPKWGSNAGKSFASILSAQGAAAAAAVASTPTVVEAAVVEAPKVAPVEAAPVPPIETKTAAPSPAPVTSQKASKTEKVVNEKVSKSTNGAKLETKTVQSSETSEKDIPVETVAAPPTPLATSDNLVGTSLTTVSSPSSSVGLVLGASPSVSRGTSDIGTLPKPLFGGLDSQLNGTGLDDQFSLGLGSGGSSSLLDLASASLSGILPSSFDLPLEGMDLGANSVLPPGLSKAIGKPTGASPGAPSLSSILGQSFSGGSGLGGLPLTSSSRDTPERNASSGTLNNVVANGSTMTQAERLAYLERELATKTQEADAHAAEVSMLRARVNELESSQLNHDERLRSSIMEKDMELLTKHQEIVKYEDDLRKSKEEKLVDLDQYFIYFSKIEEVINSMKCKEEAFSEKIKPEDVQELFQFKKLMRNYVANVKAQLKNKFDAVVAQTHLMRGSSGNAVVKDPSVEAVALGMVLPSGPPPGGLNASTSGVSSAGTASSSASTGVFGVLSSGASAAGVTSAGTSRFAGSFDTHSMPFAHNHHHGLTNVGDAFSSSTVLFPTVTDLGVATTTAAVTKQCGLPGCLKEGLYTCAGCRKISYCGEAHQRSHWGQHSQYCYAR